MKRTPLSYPYYILPALVAVCVIAWLPFNTSWLLIPLLLASGILPVLRVRYYHPLGDSRNNFPYYYWLKSMPYKPGARLPNGDVRINLQDLIALFIMAVSIVGCARNAAEDFSPFLPLVPVGISFAIFSAATAVQLLNTAPRWLAYIMFALLQCGIAGVFYGFLVGHNAVLGGIGIASLLIVTLLADLGLRHMMKHFPWQKDPLPRNGLLGFVPLEHMLYGNVDVTQTGEPFTSLRPSPRYRQVSWQEVTGLTTNITLFALLFPAWGWGTFFILGGVGLYFRFKAYWISREPPMILPRPWLRLCRPRLPVASNPSSGFATLLLIYVVGCLTLYYATFDLSRWNIGLTVCAFYLLLFKMPPTRALWETTGLCRITDCPNVSTPGSQKLFGLTVEQPTKPPQ